MKKVTIKNKTYYYDNIELCISTDIVESDRWYKKDKKRFKFEILGYSSEYPYHLLIEYPETNAELLLLIEMWNERIQPFYPELEFDGSIYDGGKQVFFHGKLFVSRQHNAIRVYSRTDDEVKSLFTHFAYNREDAVEFAKTITNTLVYYNAPY